MPPIVLIFGGGLWVVSIALKRGLAFAFEHFLRPLRAVNERARRLRAAFHGLLSAATELGVAALYLWNWQAAPLLQVLAFGVGAGCTEVIYVVILGFLTKADPGGEAAWALAARNSLWVRFTVPIERLLATIGHAGSRGLVWVGLQCAAPAGAAIVLLAGVLFTAVDGVAVYGLQKKWDWNNPRLSRRLHLYFGAISFSEMALFLLLYPRAG